VIARAIGFHKFNNLEQIQHTTAAGRLDRVSLVKASVWAQYVTPCRTSEWHSFCRTQGNFWRPKTDDSHCTVACLTVCCRFPTISHECGLHCATFAPELFQIKTTYVPRKQYFMNYVNVVFFSAFFPRQVLTYPAVCTVTATFTPTSDIRDFLSYCWKDSKCVCSRVSGLTEHMWRSVTICCLLFRNCFVCLLFICHRQFL
jgi:hypothetical protein